MTVGSGGATRFATMGGVVASGVEPPVPAVPPVAPSGGGVSPLVAIELFFEAAPSLDPQATAPVPR